MLNKNIWLVLFALIICMCSMLTATAGKLYKWVDSEGNVSYSQMPPPKDSDVKQEKIKVSGALNATNVTRHGNYEYCGDIKLPGPISDIASVYRQLRNRKSSWESSLRSTQKSLQKSINSKYKPNLEYRDGLLKNIREYKCALNWALQQDSELKSVESDIDYRFRQAQLRYDRLNAQAYDQCGPEPSSTRETRFTNDSRIKWVKCRKKLDSRLRKAKQTLDKAERDFQLLRK